MEKGLDWFDCAKEFRDMAGEKLASAEFMDLENQDFPSHLHVPVNFEVLPLEIPGIYKVQDEYRGESDLKYFMDGVQRTFLWKYYNYDGFSIPIFLHFSGAVVIYRRRPDEFLPLKSLYRRKVLVPHFLYEELEHSEGIANTGAERCWDLNDIRARGLVKSRAIRQEIEFDLARSFLRESDELLVKDGNVLGCLKSGQLVGLIKSHLALYLQSNYPDVQRLVWSMPEYHRSMIFSLAQLEDGSPGHRVNSFYLRIHERSHPESGLLRVEYSARGLDAGTLSSWLIAEKRARANCPRWDRQIYPIQKCEDYLRTKIPSHQHMSAILKAM